ncbi:MFS transporter [Sphingomonas jatrophae]|uniref:Predicted arabinose efflux permease, MFS family n=1 Tax=Sphingomonas jatrophae TaxID=1166337 RepID=A0A1I6LZY7_9SPHN|nr:MFS transporter [Sphingomonas jatrophae]SFS09007.1 Predicted arabinose efflux permease, MFS family [Sphingomonas jatrophae]
MTQERKPASKVVAGVCIAGPALVSLIPMAAAPAMPSMAARFASGGDGQLFAQLVMTAPAIMLIVSSPFAGLLAARIGRRATLLLSLLLFVVAGAGVLLVDSREHLIALRLLLGVAGGGLLTSSLTLIGEYFEDAARETVLGLATSLSSAIAALALVFGGSLVDAAGWRAPFALYMFALPVFGVGWCAIGRTSSTSSVPVSRSRPDLSPLAGVAPYYLLLMLLTVAMFTPAIQVPFLLEERGVTSAQTQGMIVAVTSVVAMVSAGLYGPLRRWIDTQSFLIIDALCMGCGILAVAILPGAGGTLLGCALVGIGAGMSEPAIASIVFDRTPAYVHAVAMGLIVSALNAGQFVNPLVMAPLRAWFGVSASFVALGAIILVIGGLLIILRPAAAVRASVLG